MKNEYEVQQEKEKIRNLVCIIKNRKMKNRKREKALKDLSDLVREGKGLEVITDEDIRDFMKITKDDKECKRIIGKTLLLLYLLVEKGRGIDVIKRSVKIEKNEDKYWWARIGD